MKRFADLRVLFTIVAVLELVYAVAGVLTPPGMVRSATGWVLGADGQWVAKLLGVALASQAWIAWMFRNHPHLGVAKALALYQLGSATADWVIWLALADQQIFSTTLGKITVVVSILVHYTLGTLLVLAIRVKRSADHAVPAHL
jgi:hypothetical protein